MPMFILLYSRLEAFNIYVYFKFHIYFKIIYHQQICDEKKNVQKKILGPFFNQI